jgi:hypothetical protein
LNTPPWLARSYLLDKGPFPKRTPVLAVGGKLLFDLALAVQQWADWAIEVVQARHDPSQAPTDWAAFEIVARHLPSRRRTPA